MIRIGVTLTALLFCLSSFSQSFYDEGTVQTIEITFAQSNWDALLDAEKAGNEDYIMAESVAINGIVYDSVGVKYKGNSTYNANQTKNPFHIELDTYKEHDHEGYKDIKLSNVANDPSFLREVLSYQVLRQYMDAPLSNYANVSVNGTLIGLYTNSEAISKTFVKSHFGSKSNTFVKCNPPAGAGPTTSDYPNLVHLGVDSSLYYDSYELNSDYGWEELINLCDTLDNDLSSIEEILDVDRALWMLAFNNTLVNLDSYSGGFAQNYYLYRDDYGRFIPIVWDLNESFGKFEMTGSGSLSSTAAKQQMDHLLHENDVNYPLISQLLSDPTYEKMYLAHFKTIMEDNFTNNGSYYTEGMTLQTTIDADVQADPNKFYTYNNFVSNITTDITSGGGPGGGSTVPGITNLMNGRYSYITALNDFSVTEPTISAITLSSNTPTIGDVITVTASITDENTVYLGYRSETEAPFEKITMFDDGLHNDGAASDGVYGVDITLTGGTTEYYIYAENNDIGKFSPTNAEHEFYNIYATTATIGDIVINEFLASNDAVVADQDGDYDDWIEIYNKGNAAVSIGNYRLTDDLTDVTLFTFPTGTTINANEYITVWADKDASTGEYHADFKLSSDGESIYLLDSSLITVDSVNYSTQTTDISYGRYPNGTGAFQSMSPTFGAENTLTVGIIEENGTVSSLKIYPNPAEDFFNIEQLGEDIKEQELFIYNINGQLTYSETLVQKTAVNTSDWSPGLYFIIMGNTSAKIIIR